MVAVCMVLVSCETHVLTYDTEEVDLTTSAQVRIVYDLPLSGSAHSLTRLKLNDNLVSEVSTVLGSIYPNSAAKYFMVSQGTLKIDAFKGATKDVPQYSNTCTVNAGKKHSVFIFDLAQPPLVVQDADVLPLADPWKDTLAHIQFVNLLYKADGVTPYGKLFLKGRRGAGTAASPYVFYDVAQCNFKEASGLIPYKLMNTNLSGTEQSMVFVLFSEDGNRVKYFPSSTGALTDYAATGLSLTKGRNYVFHLNGKEGANYAGQIIRLSTFNLN